MKVGVLSDTHGLLRPEAIAALKGCEAILHGGDINRQEIIDQLEQIAPVYAVRGNNDGDWAERLPVRRSFSLAGVRICMAHKKKDLPEDWAVCDLAVYGHSHQYEERMQGSTLFLNPGSCGPRRFRQAITLATVQISDGQMTVKRIDIPHAGEPGGVGVGGTDLKRQIEIIIKEVDKGRSAAQIEKKYGMDAALVEQIARLYVTHPGVTADGIMTKMGL